jgi:CRISPR-associated endoribonuclease Cas6
MIMEVNEINVKVYVLKNILLEQVLEDISKLIDKSFYKNENMKDFHEHNAMKNYCFNGLYPTDIKGKIYKEGCIYNFQLRCIGSKLKDHFLKFLSNEYTSNMKVLVCKNRSIPKRPIDKIYSITPIVAKMQGGKKTSYWRDSYTETEFFEYIRTTSIKKYEVLTGQSLDRNLKLFNYIKIDNRKPMAINFKQKKILGDKITLRLETSNEAQNIAYILLATGVADMCPRGYGYMNYQYVK